MTDVVEHLWDRFGALSLEQVPLDAQTAAGHCILDWFGCALAGSREPASRLVAAEVADAAGPATVLGTGGRTGTRQAALVNGTAGHALDFDDTSTVMGGHPTAPVLPAVLALGEELGVSGPDLLAAFIAGVEVESRLGAAMGPTHYGRGWHVTSTMGTVGAAAGAAHLLRLDAVQAGCALGLAASQSSGVKANFGTMAKPFHAGHAAAQGLLSARLAARGFTASSDAIAGSQGLAGAAGDGALHVERMAAHEGTWAVLGTLFKHHASCYLTHAAMEAATEARNDGPVDAVGVTVHPGLLDVCAIARPSTGLEAKFSLAGTVALALLGADTADPGTFADDRINDPGVQDLIGRVHVETDPTLPATAARVTVRTAGGVRHASVDTGVPATDLDAQGARLGAKFDRLAMPVIGSERASELAAGIAGLGELADVRDLTRGLGPPG